MNTLPSLPLVDGWLFLDNSAMESYTTCPRAFQYIHLHEKRASGESSALNFGSGIHAAMQARYTKGELLDGETEQSMFNALTKHFTEHPQPEDEYRTLDLATNLVRFYNTKYSCEDFEVCHLSDGTPCVELPFAFPLTDDHGSPVVFFYTINGQTHSLRVMYQGKIDMIIKKFNQVYTLDHKTTFQFGKTFWPDQQLSAQHVGYCWSADRLLGIETAGYIVNGIRTRKPGKTNPLPMNEDFERQTYYLTPERKQEWRNNLVAIVKELLYNYSEGTFPMKTKWCIGKFGACQFFDVCSLPSEQRALTLNSGLYVKNDWSPLNALKDKNPS